LVLPRLALHDPAFVTTLEAFTRAPVIGANRVDILLNGEETFPALLEAIEAARRTLTFEAYIFREGDIGNRIMHAIAERCREGVRASVLLDAHGSASLPDRYVRELRSAGCDIVPDFRPLRPWSLERTNKRNHRRILVIDGHVGFTGGYGIDDTWNGDGRTKGRWRETNVRLEGPVVQQLQEAFVEHWHEATGVLLGGKDYFPHEPVAVRDAPARTQVVRSSPLRDNHAMHRLFRQAIRSARTSVLISTPYLVPDDELTQELHDAGERGVTVRVLVPSLVNGEGVEYVTQATQREEFAKFLEAGSHMNEYAPALLHTKMMIVDGRWATVGSTNFDNRSMAMNDELNVVFYEEPVARRLEGIFLEDLDHSRKITTENLKRRPWVARLLGMLTSPVRDYF